jgi:hypothetical protein
MLPTLRIAIVFIAAIEIYFFSDSFRLAFETLTEGGAQWFNVASAIGTGVIAPLLALAAAGLSLAGKRLGLAGILLCLAPVPYVLPVIAFGIAVAIYGF